MTLVTTWSALGFGTGESMILTDGPAETMASFIVIVLELRTWDVMEESREAALAVVLRMEEESIRGSGNGDGSGYACKSCLFS